MKFDFLIRNPRKKTLPLKVVSFYVFFKIPESLRNIISEDPKMKNSLAYAFHFTEENTWDVYPVKVFVGKKDPKNPDSNEHILRLYIPYLRENTKRPLHLFLDEFLWPDFYADEEIYKAMIDSFGEGSSHKPFYIPLDESILMKIIMKFKNDFSFIMIHPSDQLPHEYIVQSYISSSFSDKITLVDVKGNKAFNFTLYAYDFVNLLNDHIISIRERNSKV